MTYPCYSYAISQVIFRQPVAFCLLFFIGLLIPSGLFAIDQTDSLKKALLHVNQRERSKTLNALAARIFEDDPEQAIRYASEALNLAVRNQDEKDEVRAHFLLAESYLTLEEYDSAIAHYTLTVALEKKIGGVNSEDYANRVGDLGYCYYTMEQPVKALGYLQESLSLSINGGFHTQAASMYSNIGAVYTEWGDYDKGLINNQMALVLDRKSGDSTQVSTDLNNIGKIYEQWGKYDLAVRYYIDALDIARKVGNLPMISVRLNNLGIVYKAWKKYPEALTYFNEALAIDRSIGNNAKAGKRLSYIGATWLEMGNYPKCIAYLDEALPLTLESGQQDELARLYNLYGKYHLATANYEKAVEYYGKSLDYATRKNLKPLRMGNLQGLTDAYERSGRIKEAYSVLKQFLVVKDSVFNAESDERLAEFQARFDNERMKLENTMLRKDVEMKHNIYLLSGILALSLVIILMAVIFILRLKNRNSLQAKELAERNAARFQVDLETRNRELALQAMMIIKSNETIAEIIEGLDKNIRNGQQVEDLDVVLNQVRQIEKDKSWKEFETHFTQVHSDFYQKLHDRFPDLTLNERKLCAFLRLNMTTKDIASITHQSVHSINVARTRLRRKMNLANSEENLVSYLMSL